MMEKIIKQIRLRGEQQDSLYMASIKDLNRLCVNTELKVVITKKGREKGLICLRNDIERQLQYKKRY